MSGPRGQKASVPRRSGTMPVSRPAWRRRQGARTSTRPRQSGSRDLLRESEWQERAQIEKDVASQHERLLDLAGGNAALLPYQFDYEKFREAVTEARGILDPDSEYAGQLERGLSLSKKAHEFDRRLKDNPGAPMHEQGGFRAWRAEAERFLDDRRDALRNRLMTPHLDEAHARGLLERSASTLEHEKFQAPERTKQEASRQQRRTQTLDRSEGGGVKL